MEIPLYQRTETPGVNPRPKPSYALADRSAQINFAQTAQNVSTDLFSKYIGLRQSNEEHQFIGQVYQAEEAFETYLKENPNATPQEMQVRQKEMITSLETATNDLKLPGSKQAAKEFMSANKGRIIERTNGTIAAIGLEHQTKVFNETLDYYVDNGMLNEAVDLLRANTGSNKVVSDELSEIYEKQITNQITSQNTLTAATNIRYKEGQHKGEIDLTEGQKIIKSSGLPAEVQLETMKKLNAFKAQEDIAREEQRESDRDAITKTYQDKNSTYESVIEMIENSTLDEKEQATKIKEAYEWYSTGFGKNDDSATANQIDRDIYNLRRGIGTEAEVLTLLKSNKKNLTESTYTRLQNAIPRTYDDYAESVITESRDYIDNQILQRDIANQLFGTGEQQDRAMLARMDYDSMVRAAQEKGIMLTPALLYGYAKDAVTLHPEKTKDFDAKNKKRRIEAENKRQESEKIFQQAQQRFERLTE
ncbi:MAG: hypothetical protein WC476_13405 [Phycisphaerae bacterium]|jgi:hypothetical protein